LPAKKCSGISPRHLVQKAEGVYKIPMKPENLLMIADEAKVFTPASH